jgi:hypothetical protein
MRYSAFLITIFLLRPDSHHTRRREILARRPEMALSAGVSAASPSVVNREIVSQLTIYR